MFSKIAQLLSATLLLTLVGCQAVQNTPTPVVFKFATVGDSRQQPKQAGISAQDEKWLQATPVWSRMLREIEAQKPHALVFNGDMIYGYTTNVAVLDKQYAFWRGMVAGIMERGTYVLPVAGNHEVQVPSTSADGKYEKKALVSQEHAWRDNMGDLILNQSLWKSATGTVATAWNIDNTPQIGTDGITTDQRQLSYSFDSGAVHIAVINTDPVGFDESAPITWLAADLAAAKARGAKHFFVFGHKPAFTYFPIKATKATTDPTAKPFKNRDESFATRPGLQEAFWAEMERYNATYFCGHQHVYHASQPRKAQGGSAWQVLIGSGGTPLGIPASATDNPHDAMFAWAEVSVLADGNVDIAVHGFPDAATKTARLAQWRLSKP